MSNYSRISAKTKQFHALTLFTLEEFHALHPTFGISFLVHVQTHTLENRKRQKRIYADYRNSPLPTMEDKLNINIFNMPFQAGSTLMNAVILTSLNYREEEIYE